MRAVSLRLRFGFLAAATLALGIGLPLASAEEIKFSVAAGKHDRNNTPIRIELPVDSALKNISWASVRDDAGNKLVGQITAPSLLATPAAVKTGSTTPRELHFILPELKAGEKKNFVATISTSPPPPDFLGLPGMQFQWKDTPGEHDDLSFNGRPVLRYMYHKLDESSKEARDATFKPFHHVFSPDGIQLLTKGAEGVASDFPHHHGVFYGFREVTYDGNTKCDIWHCTNAYQEHARVVSQEAGPLVARHLVEINWVGEPRLPESAQDAKAKTARKSDTGKADAKNTADLKTKVFATELREMTVYNTPGGTLIEFASRVTPTDGPIKLDGDPQHSGFHFRANNEVMRKTKNETFYIRPDGVSETKGEKGTRNWPAQKEHINLPWNAMSIVVGGKRNTIAYLDNDKNPKEARFSERDYGRFGSYFVADATKEKPVEVNYRLWVQDGEMTPPQVAALDADFDDAPQVTVK